VRCAREEEKPIPYQARAITKRHTLLFPVVVLRSSSHVCDFLLLFFDKKKSHTKKIERNIPSRHVLPLKTFSRLFSSSFLGFTIEIVSILRKENFKKII